MSVSRIASLLSSTLVRASRSSRFRSLVDQVLEDGEARDFLLHRLGTRQLHDAERIDARLPSTVQEPDDFEDLLWLLSSNYANRGIALLMLEEAAWLYDTIKAIENPRVAELGRAKGGTTFLMASAGARVLSLENGALEAANARHFGAPEISYDEALGNALTKVGISSRVEVLQADAETYPVPSATFDLVFSDIALSDHRMNVMFERWWEGVKPGGRFVLRDGREPRTPTVTRLAKSLEGRPDIHFEEPAPGVFSVLVKVSGDVAPPAPAESQAIG